MKASILFTVLITCTLSLFAETIVAEPAGSEKDEAGFVVINGKVLTFEVRVNPEKPPFTDTYYYGFDLPIEFKEPVREVCPICKISKRCSHWTEDITINGIRGFWVKSAGLKKTSTGEEYYRLNLFPYGERDEYKFAMDCWYKYHMKEGKDPPTEKDTVWAKMYACHKGTYIKDYKDNRIELGWWDCNHNLKKDLSDFYYIEPVDGHIALQCPVTGEVWIDYDDTL